MAPQTHIPKKSQWVDFRYHQKNIRIRCHKGDDPEARFGRYTESCRRSLRDAGLNESAALVALSLDVQKQGRLQNWLDFQNYHVSLHRALVARVTGGKDAKKLKPSRFGPEFDQEDLRRYDGLLTWIEEQRLKMMASTGEEEDRGSFTAGKELHSHMKKTTENIQEGAAVPQPYVSRRRLRQRNTPATSPRSKQKGGEGPVSELSKAIGSARVTKRRRRTSPRKSTTAANKAQPAVSAKTPSAGGSRGMTVPLYKSRRIAEEGRASVARKKPNVLAPTCPNKVVKKTSKAGGVRQPRAAASDATAAALTTRSGRQVRKPARYGLNEDNGL